MSDYEDGIEAAAEKITELARGCRNIANAATITSYLEPAHYSVERRCCPTRTEMIGRPGHKRCSFRRSNRGGSGGGAGGSFSVTGSGGVGYGLGAIGNALGGGVVGGSGDGGSGGALGPTTPPIVEVTPLAAVPGPVVGSGLVGWILIGLFSSYRRNRVINEKP